MIKTRPLNLEDMKERLRGFASDEGIQRGLSYSAAPTDIFISPYAKCGTTWMQQIVHGLRTNGSMAFSEITEVVPWLELAHDMGHDANAPQVAAPRAFKSHLSWDQIPKGGRYIVVLRDPIDAMLSLYRFFEGWTFETGSISLPDFADYYLDRADESNYWTHALSWWQQRQRDNVLLFCFEDMKQDLPATVHRVADFIGIPDGDECRQIATDQASFDFMKQNNHQFDDHLLRRARDAACDLPADGVSTKVNRGKVGGEKVNITQAVRDRFAKRWTETMGAECGLSSYADLRHTLYGADG